MLNDDQLDVLSSALVPLFNYLEQEVIYDIARRIKKTMTYTRTAELQAVAMEKLGYSPAKIRAECMKILNADKDYQRAVAENTLAYKKDVANLIKEIEEEARQRGDDIVANSGDMAWVSDLAVWESVGKKLTDKSFMHELVDAYMEQTDGDLLNLTKSTGFKGINGYTSIENAYRDQLNKAVVKITSGTFDQGTAIRDCVRELSQSGLRTIDYANGYSMQLESAVKNAVRTGCNQLSAEIENKNIAKTGENLVYVDSHFAARNKGVGCMNHESWQGKVYYIKKPDHSLAEEAKRIGQSSIEDLWEVTGYSQDGEHTSNPLGLHGYNCRHQHFVFFEGASSIPDKQPDFKPVTINGKVYDAYAVTQKMRLMERTIRNSKREMEALTKLGEDTTKIKAKISEQTRAYKNFCKQAGIGPSNKNLRYEFGTGDITKTKAYKEYQENVSKTEQT